MNTFFIRFCLVWNMFPKFGLWSDIKLLFWSFCRKVVKKQYKEHVGSVYVKKLKKSVWIRPYTSDFGELLDFFVNEKYEKGGHYEFSQINSEEKIDYIIDGGANIGLFSLVYGVKFPEASIIAIEPDDNNYKMLKRNCACIKNVKTIHAGIWYRKAKLGIQNPEAHADCFTVKGIENSDYGTTDFIKGISILHVMEKYDIPRIDVLKLDIEGTEFCILRENSCDEWLDKTRFLIMEIHDKYLENGREMIYSRLKEKGFEHFDYVRDDLFIKNDET